MLWTMLATMLPVASGNNSVKLKKKSTNWLTKWRQKFIGSVETA